MRMSSEMRRKEVKRIGNNITYQMLINNISKKRVAEYMDKSLPTIYDRFKDASLWTLDELLMLCTMFNCSIDSIIAK